MACGHREDFRCPQPVETGPSSARIRTATRPKHKDNAETALRPNAAAQTKWGPASLPTPTIRRPPGPACQDPIPVRFSCDRRPAKRDLRHSPELPGDGLVGPLSGAGRTWKALHHLFAASAEASAVRAMDCISCPDRVRLNSWESLRSVIRLSFDVLAGPVRSLPAGLATNPVVPVVRRLSRPMIESCHEACATPSENARKARRNRYRLWISPALATSGFAAAFL